MTLAELRDSLAGPQPPRGLRGVLQALWHDARGDWEEAHRIAQSIEDAEAAWVHAYLHRKEGDLGNASYWYSRAGKRRPEVPLEEEWEQIAAALLDR